MLAKPFLPPRWQHRRQPKGETSTEGAIHNYTDATSDKATALCFDAAREICLLGEQYRKAFGSFRQSPVTATHCTLSAVLFLIFSLNNCKRDDHDGADRSKPIWKLINSGIAMLGELAQAWMPARHYWKTLLAIVQDRQQVHGRWPATCDSPNAAPLAPESAVPHPTLTRVDESSGNNGPGGRDTAGTLEDAEMWDNIENHSFLDFDGESLFDGVMFGLSRGLNNPFPSENPSPWFAC